MRYAIRHLSRYRYAEAVDLAHHALHLLPRDSARQRVLAAELSIRPEGAASHVERDAFGNAVTFVTLDVPHHGFEVELTAELDVAQTAPPAQTPAWEAVAESVAAAAAADPDELRDFVLPSPLVRPLPEARAYAEPSFHPGRPVLAAVRDLTARIFRDFTYRPGATDVSTPVATVFRDRHGVCQDFAHVQIAALRAMGLAARYVSGYIESADAAVHTDWRGAEASHAWVAVWCGPAGWMEVDPTNDLLVSEGHATLGWGRDYTDVSPVRGVLLGGGAHRLEVAVSMKRVRAGEEGA